MEKVLITGTSCGVGRASAKKFLTMGLQVIGLDIKPSSIVHDNYKHYVCDVSNEKQLPDVSDINYLVNNAGIVTPQKLAIFVNLFGYINVIEKYGKDPCLKSILNIGSTAQYKGYDNIRYCASQGGREALTMWAANNYGNDKRHVIVNQLNLDGIVPADPSKGIEGTSMEPALYEAEGLMDQIKELSILKRLSTVEEIAEWVYFLTVVNTCVTGQTVNVDGEMLGAYSFVKYPGWDD